MIEAHDNTEELLEQVGPIVHLSKLETLLNHARANSLWPLTFGLACCAIEMMAVGASRFDLDRIGAGVFRPSARQADVMILAGTISRKMAPVIQTLWDQMPAPKWAIAMGWLHHRRRTVQVPWPVRDRRRR